MDKQVEIANTISPSFMKRFTAEVSRAPDTVYIAPEFEKAIRKIVRDELKRMLANAENP